MIADEIAKLDDLRKSGVITDQEFEQKKRALLGQSIEPAAWSVTPLKYKLWFQNLFGILLCPVGILMMLILPTYRKTGTEAVGRLGTPAKSGLIVLFLFIWLGGFLALSDMGPNPTTNTANTAAGTPPSTATSPTDNQQASGSQPSTTLDTCDSDVAVNGVKGAIANGENSKLMNEQVLDMGHIKELYFDKANNARYCEADAELNDSGGVTKLSYKLYMGPSGTNELIEVQQGDDAYNTKGMMEASKPAPKGSWDAADALKLVGKAPWDAIKSLGLAIDLQQLTGANYQTFVDTMQVGSPVERIGDYVVGEGCPEHMCGDSDAIFVIDLKTQNLYAALQADGKIIGIWGPDNNAPEPLKTWAASRQSANTDPQPAETPTPQ